MPYFKSNRLATAGDIFLMFCKIKTDPLHNKRAPKSIVEDFTREFETFNILSVDEINEKRNKCNAKYVKEYSPIFITVLFIQFLNRTIVPENKINEDEPRTASNNAITGLKRDTW
jgi:hypothetical protein